MTEKYPDQWFALTVPYQQAVADTITELVAKVEKSEERPGYAASKLMNVQPQDRLELVHS